MIDILRKGGTSHIEFSCTAAGILIVFPIEVQLYIANRSTTVYCMVGCSLA